MRRRRRHDDGAGVSLYKEGPTDPETNKENT